MSNKVKREKLCKCCNDVMEELMLMRHTFERLFQRLTHEILELRLELKEPKEPSITKQKTDSQRRSISMRSSTSFSVSPEPFAKRMKYSVVPSDSDFEIPPIKMEDMSWTENNSSTKRTKKEAITTPIMPQQPFTNDCDFREWNRLLKHDEHLQNQLCTELLQDHYEDPGKYIKHIWRSILDDEVADRYSLHGNARTNKRPLKNCTFTNIFRKCFLQRYTNSDSSYFSGRTTCYLNYANDRCRKAEKFSQDMPDTLLKFEFEALEDDCNQYDLNSNE